MSLVTVFTHPMRLATFTHSKVQVRTPTKMWSGRYCEVVKDAKRYVELCAHGALWRTTLLLETKCFYVTLLNSSFSGYSLELYPVAIVSGKPLKKPSLYLVALYPGANKTPRVAIVSGCNCIRLQLHPGVIVSGCISRGFAPVSPLYPCIRLQLYLVTVVSG